MRKQSALLWCLVGIVCVMAPGRAVADWWDNFSDLNTYNDPNFATCDWTQIPNYDANYGWESDNPQWWFMPLISNPLTAFFDANYGAMRIWCEPHPFIPNYAFAGMAPDDGVHDPNASVTFWDDTTNHYAITKVYYPGSPNDPSDPNHDCGRSQIIMHGHPSGQQGFCFEIDRHNCAYRKMDQSYHWAGHQFHTFHSNLQSGIGTNWRNLTRIWVDPNGIKAVNDPDPNNCDPNDTTWLEPPESNNRITSLDNTKWLGTDIDQWERDGFWLLMQFEIDPNYAPGDPNGKFIKGAIWNGDKYAWDGEWLLTGEMSGPYWSGGTDPLQFYFSEGRTAVASWSSDYVNWGNGFPVDVVYDDFEARKGMFDPNNPRQLDLTITNGHMGTINLNLDVPDPTDPNTAAARLCRYTNGTEIVLIAEPLSGKSLKHWIIWDPNHPGDANYTSTDTNTVLYLTMDADWEVEAAFKCGGGSDLVMPLGMVLLALFAGVVIRRKL